ncbi:TPA: hypothetical protein QB303_000715, partial [Pasteurella multocida]|nr:hypothetical protein [Pasteurella multocida]
MKFRGLYKFSDLENKNNFVFFAQLLEEMLFDYTLDTYKPSILNIHSLIEEALEVINEVENGNIKSPNISHVLDELISNLEKDIIAQNLITLPKNEINSLLKNQENRKNHGMIKNTLSIIYNSIDHKKYKESLESKIIEEINKKDNNFKNIRTLARSYITFLISNGYNSRYIRKLTLDFFWEGNDKFQNNKDINTLFQKFNFKREKYEVFFSADKILSMCILEENDDSSLISEYNRNELPDIIQDNKFLKISDNENFYSIKREGIDPFSIRESIENTISLLSNLINIFHHKKNIKWQKKFIAINSEGNIITLNEPIRSMHKCIDLMEKKAKLKLKEFLTSFQLQGDSFNKFINSVRLHSIAIHTESHENQLLNLWVALESLIPEDTKNSNESNIEHIIDSIIPFLNMYYFKSLVEKLVKDLIRWDIKTIRKSLRNVKGDNFTTKVVNLLSNNDYSGELNNLINKTRDFYLLSDRLNYFKELFSSKEKMNLVICNHSERIKWQIRRIYRAR